MRRRYGLSTTVLVAVVLVVLNNVVANYVRVPPNNFKFHEAYFNLPLSEPFRFGTVSNAIRIDLRNPSINLRIKILSGNSVAQEVMFVSDASNFDIIYKNITQVFHDVSLIANRYVKFIVSPTNLSLFAEGTTDTKYHVITSFTKPIKRNDFYGDKLLEFEIISLKPDSKLYFMDEYFYYMAPNNMTTTTTTEAPESEDQPTPSSLTKKKPAIPYAIIGVVIGGVVLSLITLAIGVLVGRKCTKGAASAKEDSDDEDEDQKSSKKSIQQTKTSDKNASSKKVKKNKKSPAKPVTAIEKLKEERRQKMASKKNKTKPADAEKSVLHKTNLESNQTWMKNADTNV